MILNSYAKTDKKDIQSKWYYCMNKMFILVLLSLSLPAFSQSVKSTIDWINVQNNKKIPKEELLWLKNNVSPEEQKKVVDLVSSLSQPAVSQLLVSYFYLDGSFERQAVKPYLDSLSVRPPDGEAGVVRIAYLASKLRTKLNNLRKKDNYYVFEFSGKSLKLPEFKENAINENIKLSFDYQPANVVLDILSRSDVGYEEILNKITVHQFDKLIKHHNQSFYSVPLTREQMATCLQIATSTKPIDLLYKYINPGGLLYFTEVRSNVVNYKKQINYLLNNEQSVFKYINATVSPLLPPNAMFSRKVSFFFINGSDGWGTDDVTAIDLNYYKDDYQKLLPLLAHETYHSGQNAVAINDKRKRKENVQGFVDVINYVFAEGTASYVSPPATKTKDEYDTAVNVGVKLLESIYDCAIVSYDANKTEQLFNDGISGAGPFYWVGAEMSKIIVDEMGKEKLASIIPCGGITFFQTYLIALKKSNKKKNMFSENFTNYIKRIK